MMKVPRKAKSLGSFFELLEDIREIRADQCRFYQKITDMYTLRTQYGKESRKTKDYFARVKTSLQRITQLNHRSYFCFCFFYSS
ncbi:RhuM family protein [Rhodonellum ikkaensis]|uniref:RhuM family protein n=2 Tax=Rhodonellum TaxID=336827 RepID=UPI00349EB38C